MIPPKVSLAPKARPTPKPRAVQLTGRFAGTAYRATQADYAKRYGKSLPTIKRWWADGKPLDDPDAMGEYLSPRGRKPAEPIEPEGFQTSGTAETDDEFEAPSIVVRTNTGDDPETDRPVMLDETFFAGTGFLAAIERLKKAERERSAAYFAAVTGGRGCSAQVLQNRFKEWVSVIEPLRKLAKDEPDIRKANELTIDKSEMEVGVSHVFNGFRLAARNLPGRAANKLIGLTTYDEIVDVLEREVEILLRALIKIAVDEAAAAAEEPTAV